MKIIILDRDGVINFDSPHYIKSPKEWRPIPGSLEAIAQLTQAGYRIAVATNQSGVNRGYYSLDDLVQIHQKMLSLCNEKGGKIEKIAFCPHLPEERCACRKPQTGMFEEIAEFFACHLSQVPYVGDRITDVEVAIKVGASPILVETGYTDDIKQAVKKYVNVPVFPDLKNYVSELLQSR